MLKIQIAAVTMFAAMLGACAVDQTSDDPTETGARDEADRPVVKPGDLAKVPEGATATPSYVMHECWGQGAGLNYDYSCSSEHEHIAYGAQVDVLSIPQFDSCTFDYRVYAVHHATGHQGWVRQASLC